MSTAGTSAAPVQDPPSPQTSPPGRGLAIQQASASRRARYTLFLLLGFNLAACGPVYLHDPAGEAAANAARTQFQEALTKGRLSDLVGTYRAQKAEQLAAMRLLQRDEVRNEVFAFSAKKWSTLTKQTADDLTETRREIVSAKSAITSNEARLAQFLRDQLGDKTKTTDLLQELNRAAEAEQRYAATQKLLASSLQAIFSGESSEAARRQALDDVLKLPVKGRSFKRDESGALIEETNEQTVGKVLGIDSSLASLVGPPRTSGQTLEALLKAVGGLGDLQRLQVGNPGIAVTIIGLGYDVALAEERRAAATIAEARRTLGLYKAQLRFLEAQERSLRRNDQRLRELDSAVRGLARSGESADDLTVETIIDRMLAAVPAAPGPDRQRARARLVDFYRQIGDNVQFRVIDSQGRDDFKNAVVALATERELALTEISLREREAVIVRGLDGLVAFHQGGIDADDVRNLIMLAQAFGVFAIAAK